MGGGIHAVPENGGDSVILRMKLRVYKLFLRRYVTARGGREAAIAFLEFGSSRKLPGLSRLRA
jgi:hypothetical protein